MAFIGVDLHSNSFTICRLEADGSEAFETFQLSEADIDRFCQSLDADDRIAVEATGNTAWFCDEIRACVGRIVVVNPRKFQVIRKSVSKTDRNDARALAFFLSRDMLPETRLRSAAEAELSSLVRTMLVRCTLIAKRYSRYLNAIYEPIKARRCSEKAIIATTRKLLSIIYDIFKNGWVFENSPQFRIIENNVLLDNPHRRTP